MFDNNFDPREQFGIPYYFVLNTNTKVIITIRNQTCIQCELFQILFYLNIYIPVTKSSLNTVSDLSSLRVITQGHHHFAELKFVLLEVYDAKTLYWTQIKNGQNWEKNRGRFFGFRKMQINVPKSELTATPKSNINPKIHMQKLSIIFPFLFY